jgi:hypothetical protein
MEKARAAQTKAGVVRTLEDEVRLRVWVVPLSGLGRGERNFGDLEQPDRDLSGRSAVGSRRAAADDSGAGVALARDWSAVKRDELLERISALPANVDIGIQVGEEHLDIVDVCPWGDGTFVALKCHAPDIRDVLLDWGSRESGRG